LVHGGNYLSSLVNDHLLPTCPHELTMKTRVNRKRNLLDGT